MLQSFKNLQIDANLVASDLVNLVLSTMGDQKQNLPSSSTVLSDELSQEGTEALGTVQSDNLHNSQRPKMTDAFAQTIVTGKIFSESLLLHNLSEQE
ncbi:hypothetical protein CEXT_68271 [Caerostris extrusa]|uniref:Uncharacterized protein n=1 Tax=Caerostris extrusa TaxID=172846 RepID=A0AAV4UVE3_CAEEX|nr:hypothetical protein CEXT_68271 [Caerostris extrusa]